MDQHVMEKPRSGSDVELRCDAVKRRTNIKRAVAPSLHEAGKRGRDRSDVVRRRDRTPKPS